MPKYGILDPVPVEDQLVEVRGLLGGEAAQAQVVQVSRPGEKKEQKLRSRKLPTLAWFITLK